MQKGHIFTVKVSLINPQRRHDTLKEVGNISMGWGVNYISDLTESLIDMEVVKAKESQLKPGEDLKNELLKSFRHLFTQDIEGAAKGKLIFAIPNVLTDYIRDRFQKLSDKNSNLEENLEQLITTFAEGFAQGLSKITQANFKIEKQNIEEQSINSFNIEPYSLCFHTKVFFKDIGPCFDAYFITNKDLFIDSVVNTKLAPTEDQ